MTPLDVPDGYVAKRHEIDGDAAVAWLAALPGLVAEFLDRWALRLDGPSRYGYESLVLPVVRADGAPAVLKVQPVTEESTAAPVGLRAWNGDGAVRLLDHDPDTTTMLLERLDGARSLDTMPDDGAALGVLAELLARLVAVPAPPGLRHLADITAAMLADVPAAAAALSDVDDRRLLLACAAATAEVATEPGEALLHWDLHYENVLAGDREPWLAIDPQPLAGDPCFELLPALDNRWADVTATGDVPRAVRRRFDLLTEVLGLDRDRASAWTLARVLQNCLWDVEDGEPRLAPVQTAVARTFLGWPQR
jgi:streptomycin 6-kinase